MEFFAYGHIARSFQDQEALNTVRVYFSWLFMLQPDQGGLPIIVDGKIIGGIGVSGVLATQDEVVAKAGIDTLTAK